MDSSTSMLMPPGLEIFSFPSDQTVKRQGFVLGNTPYSFPSIEKKILEIEVGDSSKKRILHSSKIHEKWIRISRDLDPFLFSKDFWENKFRNFFEPEYPCGFCPIHKSSVFIPEWRGNFSKYLFPERIKIIGSLYLPEEMGPGEIMIGLMGEEGSIGFKVLGDRISVYDFRISNKSRGEYEVQFQKEKVDRKFLIELNPDKSKVRISFDDKKIFEASYRSELGIRFFTVYRGEIINRINILKELKLIPE
ncbi:MAG: hypothetical protein H7A24_05490 [Leptospiraceae bacterium]|nr:hypothetical protein [Leptospiraceae bacterium]MCP5511311.1 hypothetical protein [Leptospiraceae bacterium]